MRRSVGWIAAAVGYAALARLSAHAGFVHDDVPLVVLAQGVVFAGVLLGGPWLAAAVAVGAAGQAVADGRPIGSVLLFAASAGAAGLTVLAITRFTRLRPDGERLADTLIRTAAAVAAGFVAGSLAFAANAVEGELSTPVEDWLLLVLASTAGAIVVAPFVRSWIERVARGVARIPERLALIATAIVVSLLVDTGVLGEEIGPTAYIVVAVVIWAALREGAWA